MASHANSRRDIRASISCPVYYSDGEFHASGMTENLTHRGGCLHGTHLVSVGMELNLLLIPPDTHAVMIKKATVRWVGGSHFGLELRQADCGVVGELGDANCISPSGLTSLMTQ